MFEENPLAAIKSFFFANGPQSQSYEALQQRRRIAEAMMARQRQHPKSFGEGLSAIGDAIGDRSYYNGVLGDETSAKGYETTRLNSPPPAGVSQYTPYSPDGGGAAAAPVTPAPTVGPQSSISPPPMFRPPRNTVGRPPVGGEVTPNAENWNSFVQEERPGGLGLNQPQAAGFVSNLQAESTPNILPKGVVGDNGTAFGAVQWRGPRLAALKRYAAEQGIDPFTTEAQQGFSRREMIGDAGQGPSEGGAYAALTATNNPRAAATAVNTLYERSADRSGGRETNAEKLATALPNPRDEAAAVLASRQPPSAGPAGPQDALLGEVTGMTGPTSALSFAPTANAGRVGDLPVSDAPSITGAMTGPRAATVGDSVQQRQEGFQQPQAVPSQAGPQLAQAGPFPAPRLDASGRPAAIIPGGGLPQVMQQPIQAAPQDPRAAIQKAPDQLTLPTPGEKPAPPRLLPMENERTRFYDSQAGDVRLSPTARARAHEQGQIERANIKALNDQQIAEHNAYLRPWIEAQQKARDPQTYLDIEEKRRKLAGEQINPLSPEERATIGPDLPGVKTYKDQFGKLQKIVGPQSVSVDTRGETEESKIRGKLIAERENEVVAAGNKAGEQLISISRAEALNNRIKTGHFEPGRMSMAAMGKSMGVPESVLVGLGLDPKAVGDQQAFNSIVNELAMGKIGPGGMPSNNFSEGDRKFLTSTLANLGDDPESNRIKLAAARRLSELHIERADRWGDYREEQKNAGKTPSYADFERIWLKEMKSKNALGDLQKEADNLITNAKAGPADPGIPGDLPPADRLDPGTRTKDPSGPGYFVVGPDRKWKRQ